MEKKGHVKIIDVLRSEPKNQGKTLGFFYTIAAAIKILF